MIFNTSPIAPEIEEVEKLLGTLASFSSAMVGTRLFRRGLDIWLAEAKAGYMGPLSQLAVTELKFWFNHIQDLNGKHFEPLPFAEFSFFFSFLSV